MSFVVVISRKKGKIGIGGYQDHSTLRGVPVFPGKVAQRDGKGSPKSK